MSIRRLLLKFFPRYAVGRLVVYCRLVHIDKPIGTSLLLWLTCWAMWVAMDGYPGSTVLLAFTAGVFFMRSAGCVVNDFADRNFNGAVERTKNRPFARGMVTELEAVLLAMILYLCAALCLLPLNLFTWFISLPALFLTVTYPFTKRFFPLPQLYLGVAFSFGIPMAFAAVTRSVPPVAWPLFVANILWTLVYDMVYAMADKEDDLKIGTKTSAVTFGDRDIEAVMLCHFWSMALMVVLGYKIQAPWPYWTTLPFVVWWQIEQCRAIKTCNRQVCFSTFLENNRIGLAWFLGLAGHYVWMSIQREKNMAEAV